MIQMEGELIMSLWIEDFPEFYREAHAPEGATEFKPFPWQIRLMKQVAKGDWPEVLALPTSSGKTSVIDIAIFALALQADKPRNERTAPLRIFFIIDRRIVVDEAANHAYELASKLTQALQPEALTSTLRRVAQALCRYGGEIPLNVVALRGGMYRDESWTRTPNVPTVCLSTVDQIGSRLLFRGYGIREFARPIHAGLVGNDALLIIDEGHLSNPFLETLKEVARYRDWAEQPVRSPWMVVQMSATSTANTEPFKLEPEDEQDAILSKRLSASKLTTLLEAKDEDFETRVVEQAQKLMERDGTQVLGIVVNRVASARSIFEQLRLSSAGEVILLTGRVRPFDRDRLLEKWFNRMRAGRRREKAVDSKLFVVATQTVEVGANLDFDALVTEAASLDALRQRFGRLDRLGEIQQTYAVIVLRKNETWKDDPVYGEAIVKTWEWLKKNTRNSGKLKVFDFGINAFNQTRTEGKGDFPLSVLTPAPVLFPSYIETWVQTSPTPHADPDPAPFLHGADALDAADVQVVWRDDLATVGQEKWADIVALRPPVVREALPVPIWAVRSWLTKSRQAEIADVEGVSLAKMNDDSNRKNNEKLPSLCWCGADESEVVSVDRIAPGDTIVVPCSYGGADEFGWHPQTEATVKDIGDDCANELAREFASVTGWQAKRRYFRLRLKIDGLLNELSDDTEEALPTPDETFIDNLLSTFLSTAEDNAENRFNLKAAEILLNAKDRKIIRYPSRTYNTIVLSCKPPAVNGKQLPTSPHTSTESSDDHTDIDDTASIIGAEIKLADHCRGVADWARKFAAGCGLSQRLIDDLWLAGRLHDLGKADHRFQIWLHGGDEMVWADADEPIAKSGSMQANDRTAMRHALIRSGYPKGARHELLSVALVERYPNVLAQAHDSDLVLHLVGTHHGRARPFPPVVSDPEPVEVSVDLDGQMLKAMSVHGMEKLDSGWVERFWRLVRRYGAWGVTYLETLLRLADYARSEEEQGRYGK
jgi:CRISPR-associated endonuclease/helicase Cas3